MTGQDYVPRLIDMPLKRALDSAGAVILEGARATGKTMTALNAAGSFAFLDDVRTQELVTIAPEMILEGDRPKLLDEWQIAPELWNLVRRAVDFSPNMGQFILTGSAVPADDLTRHTGAGRFLRLRQRTMTWYEKTRSEADSVSLSGLFKGELPAPDMDDSIDFNAVIRRLLMSGFPAMVDLSPAQSAARLTGYIDDISRIDVRRLADIRHSPETIKRLIAAISKSVSSKVTYKTLAADVRVTAPQIDPKTISTYIELLQRLFVVELQQPWTPQLRSRARFRLAPRVHLVDPSLAAAALGAGPEQLRDDPTLVGVLFESAVVHDLTVFASLLGGDVRCYRDSNGKEIDAVVTMPDGRWGAVEIKLGGQQISAGIESLDRAIEDIDTDSVGEPEFRLVVTGTGQTFVAADGTITCPLHALAP